MTILTDYRYGLTKENETLKDLKKKFGDNIEKTKGKFNRFDFTNGETLIELKSRRCYSNTYPDTMVGLNKYMYAMKNRDKEIIFCFNFNDGLFYHTFNPSLMYDMRKGGRTDRGKEELKDYFFIKTEHLTKIT